MIFWRQFPCFTRHSLFVVFLFFFFNDTATTEIYTLSLHDALPISHRRRAHEHRPPRLRVHEATRDRKSTRLNSSHVEISYAVFCLKKKKKKWPSIDERKKKKKRQKDKKERRRK